MLSTTTNLLTAQKPFKSLPVEAFLSDAKHAQHRTKRLFLTVSINHVNNNDMTSLSKAITVGYKRLLDSLSSALNFDANICHFSQNIVRLLIAGRRQFTNMNVINGFNGDKRVVWFRLRSVHKITFFVIHLRKVVLRALPHYLLNSALGIFVVSKMMLRGDSEFSHCFAGFQF